MKHNQYKLFSGIFLFGCMLMTSAEAYTIGQNLTIENNTYTAMTIEIKRPNNQSSIVKEIPALRTVDIYFENGDNTGWLYQFSRASFNIKDKTNGMEYVNGNVSFYVGSAYSRKYSFLNEVKAGAGINLDTAYTCDNGGSGTSFQNKIVINGTPSAPVGRLTQTKTCQGIFASSLASGTYRVTCHNYKYGEFSKIPVHLRSGMGDWPNACYWGGLRFHYCENVTQKVLDDLIGKEYCHTTTF